MQKDYLKYTSQFEYRYINFHFLNESPPEVTFEFEKNASVQKACFKYTSNVECKFVSLESLLQVFF